VSLDVDALLREISPDAPCGEDIEFDPALQELETAAMGQAETQFRDAEEPNWADVKRRALELLERSRHLRVLTYLALAEVRLSGYPGLRDGLALINGAVDRYWDTVYPLLDPEDDNDPLERMNIFATLSPPPDVMGDMLRFRERVARAPLCRSKQLGVFSLQHVQVAKGERPAPEAEGEGAAAQAPQMSVVQAAFEDCDIDELQGVAAAVDESIGLVKQLDDKLTDLVGASNAISFNPLLDVLQQAQAPLQEALARRGYGSSGGGDAAPGGAAAVAAQAAGPALSGAVNSTKDVLAAFDKICDYYQRHEPSSPVPMLIHRARRLVGKSFIDIIRDMSPDAIPQVEIISGAAGEQPEEGTY
jgi:type VI secretion system protein ImpA